MGDGPDERMDDQEDGEDPSDMGGRELSALRPLPIRVMRLRRGRLIETASIRVPEHAAYREREKRGAQAPEE